MKTHYEILGVEQTASLKEIREGYRHRVKQNHPDRNPDDPLADAKFNRIQQAFDVLSDPAQRRSYDRSLAGTPPAPSRRTETRPSWTRRPYAPPPAPGGSTGSALQPYDERRAGRAEPPQPIPPTRPTMERWEELRRREEEQREAERRLREKEQLRRQVEQFQQARREERARQAELDRQAEEAALRRARESNTRPPKPEPETSEVSDTGAGCGCLIGAALLIGIIIAAIAQCA